jgi:undecaprenyl-diphosphatase
VAFAVVIVIGHLMGGWVEMEAVAESRTFDHKIGKWVAGNRGDWPEMTAIALAVTQLGNPEIATTAVLVIAMFFFVMRRLGLGNIRRGEALFWLVVAGGGSLLSYFLKRWFRRARPPIQHRLVPEDTFSFPSGHAIFAATFFLLTAMVILRESSGIPRWARPILITLALVIGVAIAASRVWLGEHHLSDVVVGILLGLLWAGASLLIRFGWGRWVRRHPA